MYKLFTDGGARGNPGPSAIGCFLFDSKDCLVDFFGEYIGETTNNLAEYSALFEGISLAMKNGVETLHCYLDSELTVRQLTGVYKVKDAKIKVLNEKIKALKLNFKTITFNHVPREQNKFADKLVNVILDNRGS